MVGIERVGAKEGKATRRLSSLAWRRRPSSAAVIVALFLAGCDKPPSSPDPALSNEMVDDQSAIELQGHQGCMIGALNDTIYKQQSDDELETALFAQDLGACPADFIAAFVQLRIAARDYLQISREIIAHQGREGDAVDNEGLNLLCSLIKGAQCEDSFIGRWSTLNAELRARAEASKAALDSAKTNIETVIAPYGVYLRTAPKPPLADMGVTDAVGNAP